jgi:hypothetical protein
MSGKIYTEHVLIDAHPRQMSFGWTCPGCAGVYYGTLSWVGPIASQGEWHLTVNDAGEPSLDPALVCPRADDPESKGHHRWRLIDGKLERESSPIEVPPPPPGALP